jgi:hypothetical protein
MRSQLRVLYWAIAFGIIAIWGPQVLATMSEMDVFRVQEVEVLGTRFLTEDSIIAQLQIDSKSSVWEDKSVWVERVTAHPLVRSAEVRRLVPSGLRITIEERRPIALAATPTLEPVDAEGYRLPIDPARYRLDLPIITSSRTPPDAAHLFPEDVRALAAEVGRLMHSDAGFLQRVSTLRWDERGSIVARLTGPDVVFLLQPGISAHRLREGDAALADALSRTPGNVPAVIDLRFADQVVVRRKKEE